MVKPTDIRKARILALARSLHATQVADAEGRCLALSLELAANARDQLGLDLQLVKWRVQGDPKYLDHWAVMLSDSEVLDLTRVQVDGRTSLLAPLDGYPMNYVERRHYRASVVLGGTPRPPAASHGRIHPRLLWSCAHRMMKHDLRKAWQDRCGRSTVAALRYGLSFTLWLSMREITLRMEQRAAQLSARLRAGPEFPTRSAKAKDATPTSAAAQTGAPTHGRQRRH